MSGLCSEHQSRDPDCPACNATLPPELLPRSPGADVIIVCPSCEWHWVPEDIKCPNCGRGVDEPVN